MTLFRRGAKDGNVALSSRALSSRPIPDTDWADPESILAEWRNDGEKPSWGNAMHMFEEDLPAQRFNVGEYLNRRLRLALFDPSSIDADLTAEVCRRVLVSLSNVPAQFDYLHEFMPRQVRLPLAIMRDRGWQPVRYGGDGRVPVDLNVSPIVQAVATTRAPDGRYLDYFFGRC